MRNLEFRVDGFKGSSDFEFRGVGFRVEGKGVWGFGLRVGGILGV